MRLSPGETKEVTFTIDKLALSFFDDTCHEWKAESGKFEAIIAASATDIKSKVVFELDWGGKCWNNLIKVDFSINFQVKMIRDGFVKKCPVFSRMLGISIV